MCEVKVGRDRIQASQRRFLVTALRLRPLSEFVIIEMARPAGKARAVSLPGPPAALTAVGADRVAAAASADVPISPGGVAHFAGCLHKGGDLDYSGWASLSQPRAWERLGNGELLPATGGQRPSLIARSRCRDCVSHGPW